MKKILTFATVLMMLTAIMPNVQAQEWSTGLDIYSSYVWRGTKFGSGPAFQPYMEYATGGFSIGAWGSYSASIDEAAEADLYAGYSFDIGENGSLSFVFTDYFFPGSESDWFDADHHYFEPMVSAGIGSFTFSAAYMMYKADDKSQQDLYLEAALTAGSVDLTLGGGNGMYSSDGDKFEICNIGVGTSKEITITDSFSLPVSGAGIWNPAMKSFHIVVGVSL